MVSSFILHQISIDMPTYLPGSHDATLAPGCGPILSLYCYQKENRLSKGIPTVKFYFVPTGKKALPLQAVSL
jgi:hypothetical protein